MCVWRGKGVRWMCLKRFYEFNLSLTLTALKTCFSSIHNVSWSQKWQNGWSLHVLHSCRKRLVTFPSSRSGIRNSWASARAGSRCAHASSFCNCKLRHRLERGRLSRDLIACIFFFKVYQNQIPFWWEKTLEKRSLSKTSVYWRFKKSFCFKLSTRRWRKDPTVHTQS